MKQDTLLTSQPINIHLREDTKECIIKQLDRMNVSSSEQNYKTQSIQTFRPHLCMSPRCPPDGAAVHEISPSNLTKLNKSVIYENLIDRYLLMEHDNLLMKDFSSQSPVTTSSIVRHVTTTPTTSNSSLTNSHVINNNISKDFMTNRIAPQSTQITSEIMTVTSTTLHNSLPISSANSTNHLTSDSTNSYISQCNNNVNNPIKPHPSTITNTWFPPPPPPPLQDSLVTSTDLNLTTPHYHEHCRPDEVHPSVINTVADKLSNIIPNISTSSTSETNCSSQVSMSASPTHLRISASPPTPPLPPPSSPPCPPSVPPRHPGTTLQHKTPVTNSLKTTSEQTKNDIISEELLIKSDQTLTDGGNTSTVPSLMTVSKNSDSVNIPSKHTPVSQSDQISDSTTIQFNDWMTKLTNNSTDLTDSKVQAAAVSTLEEINTSSIKHPLDGRSVVPWDSNQENSVLLSTISSLQVPDKNETEVTKASNLVSHPSVVTSASLPERKNVNWAFSYPSKDLASLNLDSVNPISATKQSVKFHESKRLLNDKKSNVTTTRPNFLPDFILIKSAHPGQPSIKRLISPDDLKDERSIIRHCNIANSYGSNQHVLLENEEQDGFLQFVYPIKDPTLLSSHNREFLINGNPEIHSSNQPVSNSWLKAQQRAELINLSKTRNRVRPSCREFSQHQFSTEPVFTNMLPGVINLSPTRTHKEHLQHFNSKISPTNSGKSRSMFLMTQSSLPAGFSQQQSDFVTHHRHKSDNLVHTNPNFITDMKSTFTSGDSVHEQYYPQRNRSHNSEDSLMIDSFAPSYNNSMTQSVFFPLDSGWGPSQIESNSSSVASKHKKHRSNIIRSHSQRNSDSLASVQGSQIGMSSDQTRCQMPSNYYHRNLSQTVPAKPDSDSIWPPVFVQWHRRRPNVSASSEHFRDIIDYHGSKRYNENLHIPADYYRHQKSNFSRHHSSSTAAISEQLENQLWFHHDLSRSNAEKLLKFTPTGSFLVRRSETSKTELSLSIKRESDVLHMKISEDPETGGYVLGEYSQPYPSVSAMIYRYSRTLLPVRGTTPVLLRFPVSRTAFSHQ
ncbi:SH2 domain-containing adapter protein F [Schistosoma japonicum]|nr:SH2 domain-containing adapter protein F [Schistosoma japonicum]KAH8860772.1 SH2 domain-containing adapter protein F [Schistosoma japonicum]KAH8860773.1 SH2 domain-containing adapter protein F [Schistosoma japonicum]